jgi:hypothetical protein
MHAAWTTPGQREMYEADIVYVNGVPALAKKRLVLGAGQGRGLVLIDLAAWERTLR